MDPRDKASSTRYLRELFLVHRPPKLTWVYFPGWWAARLSENPVFPLKCSFCLSGFLQIRFEIRAGAIGMSGFIQSNNEGEGFRVLRLFSEDQDLLSNLINW